MLISNEQCTNIYSDLLIDKLQNSNKYSNTHPIELAAKPLDIYYKLIDANIEKCGCKCCRQRVMDKYNNNNDLFSMNATNLQSFELEFIQNLSERTQTNENFQVSVEYPSISLNYGDDDGIDRNKCGEICDKLPKCSTSSVVECSGVLPDCQIDINHFHNNQLKTRMLNTETNLPENNPEFSIVGILNNSDRLSCEVITEHMIPREIHDSPQQINEISQNINKIINYDELNKEKRIIDLENQNNEFVEKMRIMMDENDQLKTEIIAIKSFVNDRLRLDSSCSNMKNEILLDIPMKHFESFEYLYEDISQMRTVWAKSSVAFNSCDDKYGMILELWPRGCSHDHRDSHMCIDFKILENSRLYLDSHFDLPLNCRVTLFIGLQSSTNQNRITIEKYLNFYKYSPEKSLPQFHLSMQDLKKTNAIESDCLFIRCCVYID